MEVLRNLKNNLSELKMMLQKWLQIKLFCLAIIKERNHLETEQSRRGAWILDALATCCLPQYLGHPQQ